MEHAFERARAIDEDLVRRFPQVAEYHHGLGGRLNNIAILVANKDVAAASQLLRRAIEHQKTALRLQPGHPTYRAFLHNHYYNLAQKLEDSDPEAAEQVLGEDHPIAKALAEDFPDNPNHRLELLKLLRRRSALRLKRKALQGALADLDEAVNVARTLLTESPDSVFFRSELLGFLRERSDVHLEQNELPAAAADLDESVSLAQKQREVSQNQPFHARMLMNVLWSRAMLRLQQKQADAAVDDLNHSLSIARQQLANCPDSETARQDLLIVLCDLGMARYCAGDDCGALQTLSELNEYANLPAERNGIRCFYVAMAYWKQNKKDEARQWYDKAVEWMDQRTPDDPDLRSLRREAATLMGIEQQTFEMKDESERTSDLGPVAPAKGRE
jgi:tetratricopeptide (TPR) repeat protein